LVQVRQASREGCGSTHADMSPTKQVRKGNIPEVAAGFLFLRTPGVCPSQDWCCCGCEQLRPRCRRYLRLASTSAMLMSFAWSSYSSRCGTCASSDSEAFSSLSV